MGFLHSPQAHIISYGLTTFLFILFFCLALGALIVVNKPLPSNLRAKEQSKIIDEAIQKLGVPDEKVSQPASIAQSKTQQPVSASNKGSCIGPDNKVMSLTQKECEDFNKAWGKANNWTPAGGVVTIDCLLFDGHHILADPQTCDDFNNRKVDPEANQQNNNGGQKDEAKVTCTVSSHCTGSVNTYQLTVADCQYFQSLAINICSKYSQPTPLPPLPTSEPYKSTMTLPDTSDLNKDWPTVGPSVSQFPVECQNVGNSTVVICK